MLFFHNMTTDINELQDFADPEKQKDFLTIFKKVWILSEKMA